MCGVFVTRVLKSWLVTLTVTLPYLAWNALPSAVNRGTSGVETRMLSVVGTVPTLVLTALDVAGGAGELVAAPGAQAATASAAAVIVMAERALRRPVPGRIRMIFMKASSSLSRQGCQGELASLATAYSRGRGQLPGG